MDEGSGKVVLTEAQIPDFLQKLQVAVGQQVLMRMTVAESKAFIQGASLVFMSLEQALVGTTKIAGPNEGLPGDGEQQRPV